MSVDLNYLTESEYELINQPSDSFTVGIQSDLESESNKQWINRCNLLEIIIQDMKKENQKLREEKEAFEKKQEIFQSA